MRRFLLVGGCTLTVVVLLGSILVSRGNSGFAGLREINSQTPIPVPTLATNPDEQGKPPSSITGVSAITPPVTAAGVEDYVTSSLSWGEITGRNVRVQDIQFTTMSDFKAQRSENDPYWDNFPPTEPVVYVTLSGDFSFWDMDNKEQIYHSAYRVFSAVTGNELGGGAGPK